MTKPLVLAGVAAAALLAAAYFLVLPTMRGTSTTVADEEDEPVAQAALKEKPRRRPSEPGLVYPLTDRVLNLAGSPGALHYARIELALEFERPIAAKAAKPSKEKKGEGKGEAKAGTPPLDPALEAVAVRQPMLDDLVVRIVGAKTKEQMSSAEGKEALKAELLEAISAIVPEPALTAVYIIRLMVR